jgi:hypothetical protein
VGCPTGKFVAEVKAFAKEQGIPLFHFERNESKDRRAHQLRRERPVRDAVVFIGIAQEKAYAFSAHRLPSKRASFEFTRNNPSDFGVNKGIENMAYLKNLGRQINRRLLEVERVSQNCGLSAESSQRVVQPTVTQDGQRAPGLKFGDPRVMGLMLSLCAFGCLIDGFRSRELRRQVAASTVNRGSLSFGNGSFSRTAAPLKTGSIRGFPISEGYIFRGSTGGWD